jgi:chromosome segregation ATPase
MASVASYPNPTLLPTLQVSTFYSLRITTFGQGLLFCIVGLMLLPADLDPALTPARSQASSPPAISPSESNSSPWSAAVGGAKNGKSGRVIERLMGENDRLQREKTLASAKYEEELKRSESARSAVEFLRASNENLTSMHESDTNLLVKRERKIEELREELEYERLRRERAEMEIKETRNERDRIVQRLTKEAMEERELSKRSSTQYEVLQHSWKSQGERFDRQVQKLRASIQALQDEISVDKQKIAQIDVITEQLSQECEKSRKAKDSLIQAFDAYKNEQEKGVADIKQRAARHDQGYDQLLKDVTAVLGEMKYVVNVKNDVKSH